VKKPWMKGGAGEAWKSCHAKKCACRECQVNEMPPSRYIAHSEPICCNFQIKQRAKRVASAITTQKRSMARWRGHRSWRGSGHYMLQTWRTTTVIVTSTSAAKESTIERSCPMANHRSADRWSVIGDQPASDWRPSGGRWPTWGSRSAFLCPILLFLISFRPGSWWVCHFGL